MELGALYDLAEQENIEVIRFPMAINGSMSVMDDNGACYIGMDDAVRDGGIQERVHLSHELGHCVTGSFYNRYAAVDSRQRHENRADKWAVKKLIPVEALDDAIAEGCTEVWELAERFGVTEEFVRKAVCYHVHGNLAAELYF
jgi:Zn-dependent peptidase ImmA (M78 family)